MAHTRLPKAAAMLSTAALLALGIMSVGAQKGKPPPNPPPSTPEKIAHNGKGSPSKPYALYVINSDGTSDTSLASDRTYNRFWPDWSPDLDPATTGYQGKIAYMADSYYGADLWLMDPGGQNKVRATPTTMAGAFGPHWAPHDGYVAFAVGQYGPPAANDGVWIYGPVGPGKTPVLQRIWECTSAHHVVWTPDLDLGVNGYQGKLLVTATSGDLVAGTYTVDVSIGENGVFALEPGPPTWITTLQFVEIARTPWGLRAAHSQPLETGYRAIQVAEVTYDPATKALTIGDSHVIAQHENYWVSFPDWNSDGTMLAYDGAPCATTPYNYYLDQQEIFKVAVPQDITSPVVPVQVTHNTTSDRAPSWSPPVF
jgi:hypothetical protein